MYTKESKWHPPVPTHGLSKQLRIRKRTAISTTAYTVVLSLLGRISTRKLGVSVFYGQGEFKVGCHVTFNLYGRYI